MCGCDGCGVCVVMVVVCCDGVVVVYCDGVYVVVVCCDGGTCGCDGGGGMCRVCVKPRTLYVL